MSKPMPRRRVSGRVATWIVILAVAATVALMIFFTNSSRKSIKVTIDPNIFTLNAPALQPLDAAKVTSISVTISGKTIVATRSGDTWQLKQPISDQANAEAINNVIKMFGAIASDEIISNPNSSAKYGLNKPFAKATFTVAGVSKAFTIGREGKTNIFYVKTSANSNLYLVRGLPEELLSLRPIDLVNTRLLDFSVDDVVEIIAKAVDEDGEIVERQVKMRDGRWFKSKGTGVVFDVELLLRDLRYVNVADVLSVKGSGIDTGTTMHLEMKLKNGKTKTLNIGNKIGDQRLYYVKSSDRSHTYAVTEFIAQNLCDKLTRVGTDMMGLDPTRVEQLLISTTANDGSVKRQKFVKEEGNWKSDGNVAFSVSGIVDAILGVTAVSFAPDSNSADYGFNTMTQEQIAAGAENTSEIIALGQTISDTISSGPGSAPPGSVQIKATLDNKATIILDLGAAAPDGVNRYVKSSSRQGVYLAPAASTTSIVTALGRVRSDLMQFAAADVTKITYLTSDWVGKTSSKSIVKSGGKWSLDGKSRDTAKVEKVLTALQALLADELAPEMEEADYGFYPAADTWRLELTFKNGNKVSLDCGGFTQEGTGWFVMKNFWVRISDLTDVVSIGEYTIAEVTDAISAVF